MTEVITDSGETIATDLPAEEVADLQAKPAPAPEPAKAAEPVTPPAPAPAEVTPEPAKEPAPEPTPEAPKAKAKPIANLLSKLNDERTAREAAEKRASEAEAKLTQPAAPAPTPTATDDIDELAKKHGITDPTLLKDLADTIRKGLPAANSALPKEVQDLIAESQHQKAVQAETAAFNTRVDKLSTVFKDEPIAAHKDKLMELAYSTEKAPDGERYADKELSELYFGFIKPTIEPGTVSAEPSRGATGGGTKVTDFKDIFDRDDPKDIEAMSDEQFTAYNAWMTKTQGDVPIRHASN